MIFLKINWTLEKYMKILSEVANLFLTFFSSYPEAINGGYYAGALPIQQAHSTTPHDSAPPPPGSHSAVGVAGSGGPNSSAGGGNAGGPTGPSGPTISGGGGGPATAPPNAGLPGLPHSIVSEPDPRPSPPAPSPR